MNNEISTYNDSQDDAEKAICKRLAKVIDQSLPEAESKIWHAHPVWFLDGNPIVGYSKLKAGIRLMFWSGASFEDDKLKPGTGKFKDASIIYTDLRQVKVSDLKKWLQLAREIQWDYGNLVKRKGRLERKTSPKIESDASPKSATKSGTSHDQRMANLTFAAVYPLYLAKVEKKGRTKEELHKVMTWLTGFSSAKLQALIKEKVTFETFFDRASIHPNASLITGVICGYRVEEIENPLTQKIRYLDKLIDELAKGKELSKILRHI
jgi:hypothetical protein